MEDIIETHPGSSAALWQGDEIPEHEWKAANKQWKELKNARWRPIIYGIFNTWRAIRASEIRSENAFGETAEPFPKTKYKGASDHGWAFKGVPPEWKDSGSKRKYALWEISNDEDGFFGDRYGKWSEIRNGKERSLISQWLWCTFRNPANNFSRYVLHCPVNECAIDFWGEYDTPDDSPLIEGWHFVKATHRLTGKVYYGYREVKKDHPNWFIRKVLKRTFNASYGFKLKPKHADEFQEPDDAHKGFTYRNVGKRL